MKKYNTIITLILVLLTVEVVAQNHLIGIKGGVNWANVSPDFLQDDNKRRKQIAGGITYEYFLQNGVSIGADIIYSPRGFSYDIDILDETFTTSYDFEYLAVPIKVGIPNFGNSRLFPLAKVGLIPSILIDADITVSAFTVEDFFSEEINEDITSDISRFDLAGLAEIGLGYKATDRFWLIISAAYQHSLTSISNSEYLIEDIRHNWFTVDIGVKWALKNE